MFIWGKFWGKVPAQNGACGQRRRELKLGLQQMVSHRMFIGSVRSWESWAVGQMGWIANDMYLLCLGRLGELGSEIVPGCQRCRFRFDRATCPEACDFAHGEHVANIIEDRLIFKKIQGFSRGFLEISRSHLMWPHFSCLCAKPIRSLRSQERDSSLGAPTGGNIQWLGFQNP